MPNTIYRGILKTYDPVKGFGFITRPTGKDVFVFFRDFDEEDDSKALPGVTIEFKISDQPEKKGPRALNAKIVD